MTGETAVLGLKATRKKVDRPLPEPRVHYSARLAECKNRIGVYLLVLKGDDNMNTDRKIQGINHAFGIVRQYLDSVPLNQQSRYGRGNLAVVDMVASIRRARIEVLGGRK